VSESSTGPLAPLPPADFIDPVIEVYKRDVDVTLLIENLKRSSQERSMRFLTAMRTVFELRKAARERRSVRGATP